ncbi:MAG: type II secretion system major pseudopilin GspG [Armatimonadota bacterium]
MKKRNKKQRGFTFLEVMVVVAILAILATLIIPRLTGRVDEAKITKAVLQMRSIMQALELYKLDNGFYPTTEQGLQALVIKPTTEPIPEKWKKYMDKIPRDPWKHEYIYICPGTHITQIERESDQDYNIEENVYTTNRYDLICLGPNGEEGDEDDIVSWDMPED